MKILLITRQFPYPLRDGESIAVQMMSLGLCHAGSEVHLLALNTTKHYYDHRGMMPKELSHYGWVNTVDIDNRVKIGGAINNWLSKESYHISRYESDEVCQEIIHQLSTIDYDIIQLEGLHLLSYTGLLRKHSDAMIVYRAHNVESTIWGRILDHTKKGFRKYYLRDQVRRLFQFEINAIREVDVILPVSEEDATFFRSHITRPVKVVPIGVDRRHTMLDPSPRMSKTNRIGFIGSLDWAPNRDGLHWYIRQVHEAIIQEYKDFRLVVAGRKASDHYQEFVNYANLDWMGELEDADRFWEMIDVLIVPLLAGSGTRVKIIEALARGKHIITTSIGIEGINHEGLSSVFIADTALEWQKAITRAQNSKLSGIDHEQLLRWLHHMSYEEIGEELVRFLKEMMGENH